MNLLLHNSYKSFYKYLLVFLLGGIMSLLGLFKKKKSNVLELPPPPKFSVSKELPDIEDIHARNEQEELPPAPNPDLVPIEENSMPDDSSDLLPQFPSIPSQDEFENPVFEQVPAKKDDALVFDKTIQREEQVPFEVIHKKPAAYKTFVSLDDYSAISHSAQVVSNSLAEAEALVKKLNQLRIEENKTVDKWLGRLEDIEKKLAHVDKVLARAQV